MIQRMLKRNPFCCLSFFIFKHRHCIQNYGIRPQSLGRYSTPHLYWITINNKHKSTCNTFFICASFLKPSVLLI